MRMDMSSCIRKVLLPAGAGGAMERPISNVVSF